MIFDTTGRVTAGFHVLGRPGFPVHLLEARRPALFEAGLACMGPAYVRDIRRVAAARPPAYLFLTHVHFDHCGAAAWLQAAFEGLQVCAAERARQILARPNAVSNIARLSRQVVPWVAAEAPESAAGPPFAPFEIDRVVADGDRIEIDRGLTVEVLATPGHTRDSLSYYVPQKKILLAGEAGGILDPHGYHFTEFLADYDAYMASLERLASLAVEVLCQSHHQVFTGDDARAFFPRAAAAAVRFRNWVEALLDREHGDQQRVVARIKAVEYDPRPRPKQPEPAYLINLQARVRHLAERRR